MAYAYDTVAYPSRPVALSHPAYLGALATLYGHKVAPFETSRVLEIGCGEGVNLMSMAMGAPNAQFVGIDLSESAIRAGQNLARAAEIGNVRLKVENILGITEAYGQFDTIIAHGVYSWTPEPVRAALMRLGASLLRPDGLFFVSYNLLPGCRTRQMLRDILKYTVREAQSPADVLARAGVVLKAYEPAWAKGKPLEAALAEEARAMLEREIEALYHDELGEIYTPDLFSDVVAAAKAVGLSYLCDAMPQLSAPAFFPEPAEPGAPRLDRIELEQRSDFATLRQFRRSLFCFGDAFDCEPDSKKLKNLWARGEFTREPAGDGADADKVTLVAGNGARLTVRDAPFIQFLNDLSAAWPKAISLSSVAEQPALARQVIRLALNRIVEVLSYPTPVSSTGGERPMVSRLVRAQVAAGSMRVASLRHYSLAFEEASTRDFLLLLDGSRTRAELAEHVRESQGIPLEEARRKVDEIIEAFGGFALFPA
jgi:SAM-dependent methyltransferase